MKPQAQPYRRGAREPGLALTAMLRGRTGSGWNPKDIERLAMTLADAGKKTRERPPRPGRPARPQRPPR